MAWSKAMKKRKNRVLPLLILLLAKVDLYGVPLALAASAPAAAAAAPTTAAQVTSAPAAAAAATALPPAAQVEHGGVASSPLEDSTSSSSSSKTTESGHQLVADGLSIDIVAAEAAARPAAVLPSQYAIKGVIDPSSPLFSEDPGVLIPLAQGNSPVGDWLAAVEAAGPGTPLSDPMFVGTVFIPHNEAFEELYPELRALKLQGKPVGAAFGNVSTANLALQLNCLTVPGAAIKSHDLTPGRLLRTAGFGALKVISSSTPEKPARLQHMPSGVYFSVLEMDLQSGSAVAHVIDVLPPAALLFSKAALTQQQQGGGGGDPQQSRQYYSSVMMALTDPMRRLQSFAWLVQKAEAEGSLLTALLSSRMDAFTLFAPNEQAMAALMASLSPVTRHRLLTNASLADQFVSSHMVLGTGLGSKALEALLPSGQLRTPEGSVLVTTSAEDPAGTKLPPGAVAIVEAGKATNGTAAARASPAAPAPAAPAAPAPAPSPATPAQNASAAAPEAAVAATPAAVDDDDGTLQVSSSSAEEALVDRTPLSEPTPPAPPQLPSPAAAAAAAPAAAAPAEAAGAVAGGPAGSHIMAALARQQQLLTVAGAAVVARDLVGGKGVLHVVDRVLISPELSEELGLPANVGYSPPEPPRAAAASSAGQQRHRHVTSLISAAAACLLLLL